MKSLTTFVCGRFGWSCNNLGLWKVRIAVSKASKMSTTPDKLQVAKTGQLQKCRVDCLGLCTLVN